MNATERRTALIVALIIVVTTLVAIAVMLAGSARAQDEVADIAFVSALAEEGMFGDDDVLIAAGHYACAIMDNTDSVIPAWVMFQRRFDWPKDDAAYAVGASIGAYCKWNEPLMDAVG